MASNCVVEKKVVVSNDFKSNWVPETQEVEGVFFMKVSKWDRSFVRFCTGQALQFSGGPRQDVNVSFLGGGCGGEEYLMMRLVPGRPNV